MMGRSSLLRFLLVFLASCPIPFPASLKTHRSYCSIIRPPHPSFINILPNLPYYILTEMRFHSLLQPKYITIPTKLGPTYLLTFCVIHHICTVCNVPYVLYIHSTNSANQRKKKRVISHPNSPNPSTPQKLHARASYPCHVSTF